MSGEQRSTSNVQLPTFNGDLHQGFAVQITRKDGSAFFAVSGSGNYPAVWTMANRRFAVKHADDLRENGFSCRVVSVMFSYPKLIQGGVPS
jgi:hypothetical protein